MRLLLIVCILFYSPFSNEQQLKTDPVSDAPSVPENRESSVDAISDSSTNLYDPSSTNETVISEDYLNSPSTLDNSVTSGEPTQIPNVVIGNDKYDINTTIFMEASESEGNETSVKSFKPVLRKCCEFGRNLTQRGCEVTDGVVPFEPIIIHNVPQVLATDETEPVNETFDLVFGDVCQYGRYRLEPLTEPTDEFYLLDNGSLWLPAISTIIPGADEFCLESFIEEEDYDDVIVLPLVCFPKPSEPIENDEDLKWILYPAGMLLSVPFLLVILFAHMLIPKLHGSIQGKCLMCHVIALTFAYLGLAAIQLSRSMLPMDICVFIAFTVQFSFLCCFAWLNVLCFDVWRRLRKIPSSEAQNKSARRKVMIFYSIYATACPILIIIVSMVMDLTPSIPASYIKPQFGVASCWFLTDDAALPYFYGPIGLMIFANFILFTLTVINIHKYKKDDGNTTSGNRQLELVRTLTTLRRNIRLCFTLFILMGISWTMEIISWAVGKQGKLFKSVWYVTDVINSLQGVFIFVIFLLDGGFRQLVKERSKECWYDSDDLNDGRSNNQPEESILLPDIHSNHSQ